LNFDANAIAAKLVLVWVNLKCAEAIHGRGVLFE